MTRGRLSIAPLALALLLLIAACADGVFAPRHADRGIGGTGIAGAGTGVADRGIGGTGIVGTVTAFGSIWINGLRVELPPDTPVRVEEQAATVGDVRIGQVLAVTAAATGPTGLSAKRIEVRYAVAGPVDRVVPGGAVVLGQRIDAADALDRDRLAAGAWVAVSGLRRVDGVIVAGRIDPWSPARGWMLRGRLEAVEPQRLRVAGLTIGRAAALTETGAALKTLGRSLRVAGQRPGVAQSVALDPVNPFGEAVAALSVETYADALGALADEVPVDTTGVTAFAPGSRIVIDSVVSRRGSGGGNAARAFDAPGLGGREAAGADPGGRAADFGRAAAAAGAMGGFGAPSGLAPGGMMDHPGFGTRATDAPDGAAPAGTMGGAWGGSGRGGETGRGAGASGGLSGLNGPGGPGPGGPGQGGLGPGGLGLGGPGFGGSTVGSLGPGGGPGGPPGPGGVSGPGGPPGGSPTGGSGASGRGGVSR